MTSKIKKPRIIRITARLSDAFGNFGFGATGAQAGQDSDFMTAIGHAASVVEHRRLNDPINTRDIQ